jgi:hypothetical protein
VEKLARFSKAKQLAHDSQSTFSEARIITDVRPIFASDHVGPPIGAIVIHTLKIDYWQESSQKELYLLVDDEDIETLKKALDHATEKSKALTEFIRAAHTEYMQID